MCLCTHKIVIEGQEPVKEGRGRFTLLQAGEVYMDIYMYNAPDADVSCKENSKRRKHDAERTKIARTSNVGVSRPPWWDCGRIPGSGQLFGRLRVSIGVKIFAAEP